jgi:transglutaminase-like putative cysteine protease
MAIDNHKMTPVLMGIHLVALPLYPRMPAYIVFMMAALTLWTVLIILGRMSQPKKLMRMLLAAIIIFSLVISYGSVLGQEPGTSMLLMLSFLKLFEMKDKRDAIIVIFMSYFLVASNFFHTQSPWIAVYVFAVVVYLTSLLIIFSDRLDSMDFRSRLRVSGKMILQATPLMLILFILFPRINGPLWALPDDAKVAKTGISEEMSPGSINSLISSGAVAFRVQFEGEPPPHEELYWRGLVLSHYDGKTWTRDDAPLHTRPDVIYEDIEENINKYVVTLESHGRTWLYSLEQMVVYDSKYRVTRELQLFADDKINDVVIYTMQSNARAINRGLFAPEARKNLTLPIDINQRTSKLAKQLKAKANGNNKLFIEAVLEYFRDQEFFYTLSPPLLGQHAMDDFLFETRRGFCEHYASAFVHLMRAGGIPARVIIGYQGGIVNPVDDYMIVRQSDAHAWAEVWLNDRGWIRVDPTAAVSPDRIERGIQNAGVELARLPSILISNNFLFLKMRYHWDSFHNTWNQWVVGFNDKKQKELFKRLGVENVNAVTLVAWLVAAMSVCGGLVALWVFRRSHDVTKDKARYYYDVFCNKFEKAGLAREPYESAREYLVRITSMFPSVEGKAAMIINYYQELRYGCDSNEERMKQFVHCVKQFKVKSNR